MCYCFFFKQKTAYEMRISDWSSDVCSSDLGGHTHWAANLASGGFGTQVTVETHDGLKKILGGPAYMVTGMAKVARIEPIAARMRGPDFAWGGDLIALGVGNGRQAGRKSARAGKSR